MIKLEDPSDFEIEGQSQVNNGLENGEHAPQTLNELATAIENLKTAFPERRQFHGTLKELLGNNVGIVASWISFMPYFSSQEIPDELKNLGKELSTAIKAKVDKANESMFLARGKAREATLEFDDKNFDGVSETDFEEVMKIVDRIQQFCVEHREEK